MSAEKHSIEIRPARPVEAEEIAACLALAFEPFRAQYTEGAFEDTVLSPESLRRRMDRMTVYIAVADGREIVGTLAAEASNKEGHLRGMAVRPEWQGHHIAEQLLAKAENDLRTAGCTSVTLDTTLPLQRAAHFYTKNGFSPSGKVTDFFGMPLYEFAKLWSSETPPPAPASDRSVDRS